MPAALSSLTKISGVLFDLDGTLIDSAPAIAQALNQVIAARGGIAVTEQKVRSLVSRGAAELVAAAFGDHATTPERDLGDFRTVYAVLPADPADLYPGARAMLEQLYASGLALGICTNKPQGLTENLLSDLGLAPLFAAVVGGDATARAKPYPDPLHLALEKMGVPAAMAVYVGDSEVDGEAAARAGLPFILATYGYATVPLEGIPHQVRLDGLAGLPALLRTLKG